MEYEDILPLDRAIVDLFHQYSTPKADGLLHGPGGYMVGPDHHYIDQEIKATDNTADTNPYPNDP